jgi:hypothetical protein
MDDLLEQVLQEQAQTDFPQKKAVNPPKDDEDCFGKQLI